MELGWFEPGSTGKSSGIAHVHTTGSTQSSVVYVQNTLGVTLDAFTGCTTREKSKDSATHDDQLDWDMATSDIHDVLKGLQYMYVRYSDMGICI